MRVKKWNCFIFWLLRNTAGVIFRLIYHFKCNKYKLDKHKPYIILANHTAQIDPVLVSTSFNRAIHYVMLDIITESKYGKLIQFFFNPIPKTKDLVDIKAVRNIHEIISQNGVVGLFPSGDCTVTGIESQIDPSIAKLLKKINAEVLLYRTYGLYGVRPRFSNKRRKGKTEGKVVDKITVEELATLSSEEIYSRITNSLYCNQVEENTQKFKSKNSAEYLEKVLYVCPDCYSLNSLESSGNIIRCKKCGFSASYTEDLHFKRENHNNIEKTNDLNTVEEWIKFEKDLSIDFVRKAYDPYDVQSNKIILTDDIKCLEFRKRRRRRSRSIRRFRNGYITLYSNRIEIYKDMKIINIPLKNAILSYQMRSVLVIYTQDEVYKVFGKDRFNALKYLHFVDTMKENGMIR